MFDHWFDHTIKEVHIFNEDNDVLNEPCLGFKTTFGSINRKTPYNKNDRNRSVLSVSFGTRVNCFQYEFNFCSQCPLVCYFIFLPFEIKQWLIFFSLLPLETIVLKLGRSTASKTAVRRQNKQLNCRSIYSIWIEDLFVSITMAGVVIFGDVWWNCMKGASFNHMTMMRMASWYPCWYRWD